MIRGNFMPPFAWFLYFALPTRAGIYMAGRSTGGRERIACLRDTRRAAVGAGAGAETKPREPWA